MGVQRMNPRGERKCGMCHRVCALRWKLGDMCRYSIEDGLVAGWVVRRRREGEMRGESCPRIGHGLRRQKTGTARLGCEGIRRNGTENATSQQQEETWPSTCTMKSMWPLLSQRPGGKFTSHTPRTSLRRCRGSALS